MKGKSVFSIVSLGLLFGTVLTSCQQNVSNPSEGPSTSEISSSQVPTSSQQTSSNSSEDPLTSADSSEQVPTSSQQTSSDSSEGPTTSEDGSQQEKEWAKNTVLPSDYGYVLPSAAEAEVGSDVTYTVVSNDAEHYDPVAIEVNGERFDLDENNAYTASMAAEGNEVFPIFKADVGDFRVTPDYYSVTVQKIDGALYSLSNGTWTTDWQTSNVFNDPKDDPEHRIVPHTEYVVSVRIPGNEEKGLLDSDVATKTIKTIPNRETAMSNIVNTDFAYSGTLSMTAKSFGQTVQSYSFQTQSVLTDKRFVFKLDGDVAGSELHNTISYVAGEYGLLSQETVDYTNTVTTLPVDGQTTFASQFMNPFGTITNDEVSLSDDQTYLTVHTDEILYPYLFPMLLAGDPECTVTSVTIPLDSDMKPEGLQFEGYFNESGMTIEISYEGTLVDPDSIQAETVQPYATLPEHQQLQTLFTNLANHNYTVEVTDSNETEKSYIYVNPEEALFVAADGTKSGIAQVEGGFTRFDVETDEESNEYMQGWEGYPMANHNISEYQIPFSFAPEVFSYDNGTFHLRDDNNLYNVVNFVLPDSINVDSKGYSWIDTGSLDITLNENGATFTYTYTDSTNEETGTITAVVTNIGSTEIPEMEFVPYSA